MNLEELLAAINSYANQDELMEGIKTKAKKIYQTAFNDGHAVATGQAGTAETKLKGELEAAKQAKKAAEDALQQFKSTSNVEELRATYDKRIADKDAEILKLKNDQVESDRKGKVGTVSGKVLSGLKSLIDDDKAETLVEKKSTADRIRFDEATNRVQVYQSNGVPFAGSEDEQVAALVDELKTGVPDTLHKSSVAAGTGRNNAAPVGGSNGGAPKPKSKEFYDNIRNEARAKGQRKVATVMATDGETIIPPEQALNRRLGLRER